MLSRQESEDTLWLTKYFYGGKQVADIFDATWMPSVGEIVLVENKQKVVEKVVWDLWNCEIFIYLGET